MHPFITSRVDLMIEQFQKFIVITLPLHNFCLMTNKIPKLPASRQSKNHWWNNVSTESGQVVLKYKLKFGRMRNRSHQN